MPWLSAGALWVSQVGGPQTPGFGQEQRGDQWLKKGGQQKQMNLEQSCALPQGAYDRSKTLNLTQSNQESLGCFELKSDMI